MAITFASDLGALPIQAHFANSSGALGPSEWANLLPGKGEDRSYFKTLEAVPPPGFRLGAIVVKDEGTVVAVVPVFRTVYRFDTSLQGHLRWIGDRLYQHVPRLVSMQVLSLGLPLSDNSHIGLAPGLSADQRLAVIREMLNCLKSKGRGDSFNFGEEFTDRGSRSVRQGVHLVRLRARHRHTECHSRFALS